MAKFTTVQIAALLATAILFLAALTTLTTHTEPTKIQEQKIAVGNIKLNITKPNTSNTVSVLKINIQNPPGGK